MTREDAQSRKAELERRRDGLVDQLTEIDTQSATMSSGGGSKSYTNRSVADIKAKIAFLDREIARLNYALGLGPDPSTPTTVEVRFNG
jgi:hypothetical protein